MDEAILGAATGTGMLILSDIILIEMDEGVPLDRISISSDGNGSMPAFNRKGRIVPGGDADIVVLDADLTIRHVFAKGRCMVRDGEAVGRGTFES